MNVQAIQVESSNLDIQALENRWTFSTDFLKEIEISVSAILSTEMKNRGLEATIS